MIVLFLKFLAASNVETILATLTSKQIIETLLLVLSLFVARSLRFALLTRDLKRFHFIAAAGATLQAYALNSLIPFRVGDIWRINKLRVLRKCSVLDAAALSLFDRVFDALFCVILMVPAGMSIASILLSQYHLDAINYRNISLVTLAVCIGALIVTLLLKRKSAITKQGEAYYRLFVSMKNLIIPMFFASALVWMVEYLVCESVAKTLGLSVPVALMCFVIGFSNLLAAFVPSPGGVGSFEAAVIWLLSTFNGVSFMLASTYSIIVHSVLIIPVTLAGLTWLTLELAGKWSQLRLLRA